MFSQISGNFGGHVPQGAANDGRAAANSDYMTTMQSTTSTVVANAQQEQLYRKNVEGNVNLYRNQRLDKSQARHRDPLHHKNVRVAEDLPRVGWKVEFESGASDSALSPDMPDYFLTSEFFEVANHETTSALGKDIGHLNSIQHLAGAEHSSGMVTSGKVTNLRGEERILDDSAISDDAPLWWRGKNTIISKNLGYKTREAAKMRQAEIMKQHMNGYHERNPVLQKWPKNEPLDLRITGDKGVKVDFGPNGPTDSAISADLPEYFLTNPNFEVVNHVHDARHGSNNQLLAGAGTGVKSSTTVGAKVLADTSISGDMPEWCVKGASEINPVPLSKYNKAPTPRVNRVNMETVNHSSAVDNSTRRSSGHTSPKSQLDGILNWDAKTSPKRNHGSSTMRRSGSEIISPKRRQNNPGLNVSVSSTGINVYDTAKMTSGAATYSRNKRPLEWQNRNGAPRLNVGPKSGQDNFSRSVVGDVYMKPTKTMNSADFQPYDHRCAHRSGWNKLPRERSKQPLGPYTAGYRKWD